MDLKTRLAQYAPIKLTADFTHLSDNDRHILPLLFEAAQAMDEPFWVQNYGKQQKLLAQTADPDLQRLLKLNYGPWDKMHGGEPLLEGVGPKPAGANFYPSNMTTEEFEVAAAVQPNLKSPYTMVRRNNEGKLVALPYHQFFNKNVQFAAEKLRQAAELAHDPILKTYLTMRAEALLTDDYRASDFAWMDMKANTLDIIIGPMEIEDRLLGIKTAYAASILIQDKQWSGQLSQYVGLLPHFQETLPTANIYKQERPGLESELGVYNVIYCAGNDKVSPPSGISWPDDEIVQRDKGTRSILVKNMMRVRFDRNFLPLANMFITPEQRPFVTFEAHYYFVMLHELAHSLGPKFTINNNNLVKDAMKELNHVIEEGKAEVLALFLMSQLQQEEYVTKSDWRDVMVTALVKLLNNGDSRQSIIWLNFFKEKGAYIRDEQTGSYQVNLAQVDSAVNELAGQILQIQGSGDYTAAEAFVEQYGRPDKDLEQDNIRIDEANIPFGLEVEQGG